MRRYLYVGQVLGLLVGFYLVCALLVGGFVGLTVAAFAFGGVNRLSLLLAVVTLAAIFVVIRGVFVSTHVRTRDIVGVEATPAAEPALWARIRHLAQQVGTRAPRRIFLVPDVNAAVWENTRLLGLIPGRRQMMIGVPLLMALPPAQMDAVLAHELGHYGNRDTRLGGLVGRARAGVMGAVRAAGRRRKVELPGAVLFVAVFRWYAKIVLGVTQEASRAQELAADRVAGAIAGRANAVAALGEMRVIDAAYDFYLDRYATAGLRIGLLPPPPEVLGGFTALLADPSRRAELEKVRDEPDTGKSDPYDSHPPTTERIAALMALPDDGVPPDASGTRAIAVLSNPPDLLARVALRALEKESAGKQAVPWDALAQAAGLHGAQEQAKPLLEVVARLSGRPADLRSLVDLIAAGRFGEILAALPQNEAARKTGATGRVAREHAKTELGPMLGGWLLADAARTGRALWTHSWAKTGGDLQMAPELKAELNAAVNALLSVRPDAGPLRALALGPAVAA